MSLFGADGANQAIGNIVSTGMGIIAANHGAYKQYKYQSQLQEQAAALNYRYGKKTTINKYGWDRQGLEKAGYNPMLAVQGSSSPVSSGFTSSGQSSTPDYSGASNAATTARLASAQERNINADTELKSNQSAVETAKYLNTEADTYIKGLDGILKQKDISSYEKRLASDLKLQLEQAKYYQGMTVAGMIQANASSLGSQAQMVNAEANALGVKNRSSHNIKLGPMSFGREGYGPMKIKFDFRRTHK